MAQPFRFIAHNGEINTIQGNRNWMTARNAGACRMPTGLAAEALEPGRQLDRVGLRQPRQRRGALYHGGRIVAPCADDAGARTVGAAPGHAGRAPRFLRLPRGLMEQWDGPAAMAFTDGVLAGATLDRNGLRPLRYAITNDGLLIAGSEAGTVAVDQRTIVEKGRLGPGQMIVVDTRRRVVLRNPEIKAEVAGLRAVAGLDRGRAGPLR